jgi:AcrR family transcriptional regulator
VIARPHTGSRRNEAAEQAILRAAAELLAAGDGALITVAAIAERAGVGKQTIYRWWPSKSAVLLDAMIHRAEEVAPAPDSGDLQTDLRLFLRSTFAAAPANRSLLLGVLREALGDAATMEQLASFTSVRRDALAQILDRARALGQIPSVERLDNVVDQAFGFLWYRMIFAHQPLDEHAADDLAAALVTQLHTDQEG